MSEISLNIIKDLKYLNCIEYFEGELLTCFVNSKNELYLFSWIDLSDNCNIWLVFKSSLENIRNYIKNKSLKSLISSSLEDVVYEVHINSKFEIINVIDHNINNLSNDWLPND